MISKLEQNPGALWQIFSYTTYNHGNMLHHLVLQLTYTLTDLSSLLLTVLRLAL